MRTLWGLVKSWHSGTDKTTGWDNGVLLRFDLDTSHRFFHWKDWKFLKVFTGDTSHCSFSDWTFLKVFIGETSHHFFALKILEILKSFHRWHCFFRWKDCKSLKVFTGETSRWCPLTVHSLQQEKGARNTDDCETLSAWRHIQIAIDFIWRHFQIAIKFSRQLLLASSAKCRESLSRDLKIEKFANRWLKESKDKTTRWEKGRKMDAPKVYPQRVLAKIQNNWFGLINLSIALPFWLINIF